MGVFQKVSLNHAPLKGGPLRVKSTTETMEYNGGLWPLKLHPGCPLLLRPRKQVIPFKGIQEAHPGVTPSSGLPSPEATPGGSIEWLFPCGPDCLPSLALSTSREIYPQ